MLLLEAVVILGLQQINHKYQWQVVVFFQVTLMVCVCKSIASLTKIHKLPNVKNDKYWFTKWWLNCFKKNVLVENKKTLGNASTHRSLIYHYYRLSLLLIFSSFLFLALYVCVCVCAPRPALFNRISCVMISRLTSQHDKSSYICGRVCKCVLTCFVPLN